jgi:hypothetical protein
MEPKLALSDLQTLRRLPRGCRAAATRPLIRLSPRSRRIRGRDAGPTRGENHRLTPGGSYWAPRPAASRPAMFDGVKQCGIYPRQAGQHHGIASVAPPFILVDCPRLSWIGHDHSKTRLLQKAAHPRTVHSSFHDRSRGRREKVLASERERLGDIR